MTRLVAACRDGLLAAVPLVGIAWLLDANVHLKLGLLGPNYFSAVVGLCVAAALLSKTYGKSAGALDLALALAALAAWLWGAVQHQAWLTTVHERGIDKWLPAVVGLVLALEATRKHAGLAMTALVWAFVVYAMFGHHLSGLFEATYSAPAKVPIYLYSDTNAVLGVVVQTGATLVLGFMVMGKIMERGGATEFFNNAALAAMGGKRGGAGKVEVVASSVFGTINGTTVGNIMGTGIITIPLMKSHGFRPHVAAAIEAVSSNGGQIAPPVMGTTAFLIAEFLQMPYADIALAGIIPAVVYYWVLLMQVDRYAARHGLAGVDKDKLPKFRAVFLTGWPFLLPLALLIYLLFHLGYNPGKSAIYTAALLLVLNAVQAWRLPRPGEFWAMLVACGRDLAPLLVICAAAGMVIGVLALTGLDQQMTIILARTAQAYGLLVMLVTTALIAIVLGMGMPTAAVYIVLSVVLAPALVKMGVQPLAAHFFLFYFGLLSMLTPPVAIASYVAAGIAGADMWKTGLTGMKLAASGYLLPFLFVYNPAILGLGTTTEVVIGAFTAIMSGWVLAYALEGFGRGAALDLAAGAGLFAAAVAIGAAPVWLGVGNIAAAIPGALALALILFLPRRRQKAGAAP